MNGFSDLIVTLSVGSSQRSFTLREIVHEHGDPGLAGKLVALAFGSGPLEASSTSAYKQYSLSQNANAVQKIQSALAFREEEDFLRSERLVAPSTAVDIDPAEHERFAAYLADTFGDSAHRNLAFYRLVVRTVARERILDALDRAKDARDVRKSRAHLFAFLVRPYLPRRSFTKTTNS